MNTIRMHLYQWAGWGSRAALLLVFAVGATLLLAWLAGRFAPKVLLSAERPLASEGQRARQRCPGAPGSAANGRDGRGEHPARA